MESPKVGVDSPAVARVVEMIRDEMKPEADDAQKPSRPGTEAVSPANFGEVVDVGRFGAEENDCDVMIRCWDYGPAGSHCERGL